MGRRLAFSLIRPIAAVLLFTGFLFLREDAAPVKRSRASDPLAGVPEANMGRVSRSPLVNAPGYYPPDDPESLAAVRGRREVGPTDQEFLFGKSSPESLAAAIVGAVRGGEARGLLQLRILEEEFEGILWPEFPASRPITNVTVDDAWENLLQHSEGGIRKGLSEWGGQDLRFQRLTYEGGVERYTNFRLVHGVTIHAVDPNGRVVIMDFAPSFAERNGRWKVYIYKD